MQELILNTLFFSYNIDSREKRAMYQIYNGMSASLKSLFYHREEEEQQNAIAIIILLQVEATV